MFIIQSLESSGCTIPEKNKKQIKKVNKINPGNHEGLSFNHQRHPVTPPLTKEGGGDPNKGFRV